MTMSSKACAGYWVKALGLEPHPEGGYFRESYRSRELCPAAGLPERFSGPRSLSTAIYYLLEKGQFSAFHKIMSDEVLHFYAGGCLEVYILKKGGGFEQKALGPHWDKGETFQMVIPAGNWFALSPAPGAEFSLIGSTVAPGFDFTDFELGGREKLTALFPDSKDLISRFTYHGQQQRERKESP